MLGISWSSKLADLTFGHIIIGYLIFIVAKALLSWLRLDPGPKGSLAQAAELSISFEQDKDDEGTTPPLPGN